MKEIDLIALAGLLHDIGKFGQRADNYALREGAYKKYDYKYTHAAYTAQILNDLVFNLGDEMGDAAAMHHNPQNDIQWIIAADRMASGFEREKFNEFNEYNEKYDKEDFKKQRLWYLFDKNKRYKIDTLNPDNIYPQDDNAITNEYNALWDHFVDEMKKIKEKGNRSTTSTITDSNGFVSTLSIHSRSNPKLFTEISKRKPTSHRCSPFFRTLNSQTTLSHSKSLQR